MNSAATAGVLAVVVALGAIGRANAEDAGGGAFGPWKAEAFRTGLAAVSRSDDRRATLSIFCTISGTRSLIYAYDTRGLQPGEIPFAAAHVRATAMIDVLGLLVPSNAARFDIAGQTARMEISLPADFDPGTAEQLTIESGPGAPPASRWSIAVGGVGLDGAARMAFKSCV